MDYRPCPELCGGYAAMRIPTATQHRTAFSSRRRMALLARSTRRGLSRTVTVPLGPPETFVMEIIRVEIYNRYHGVNGGAPNSLPLVRR